MSDNKKPKYFLVLKIVGFIFLIVGIAGAVISGLNFGNFDNNLFMVGGIMASVGFFVGFVCFIIGFMPEIQRIGVKTSKYIQEQNKEDLTDIANTSADISSEAITKSAKAVKKGLEGTKFCKHCGKEIDADSKFCSYCGKEQ